MDATKRLTLLVIDFAVNWYGMQSSSSAASTSSLVLVYFRNIQRSDSIRRDENSSGANSVEEHEFRELVIFLNFFTNLIHNLLTSALQYGGRSFYIL